MSFDCADACESLLSVVDLEGAFDVLEPLGDLGVLVEPLIAPVASERPPSHVSSGVLELRGELIGDWFADLIPPLLQQSFLQSPALAVGSPVSPDAPSGARAGGELFGLSAVRFGVNELAGEVAGSRVPPFTATDAQVA